MFLKLVRRDRVTHYGPLWIPLAAPIGVILAAFGSEGIVPSTDGDFVGPVLLIWVLATFMMGFAQVGQRADTLKVSLPLPARTVWLARLTSIVVFFVGMMGVALVFMVAFNDREKQPLVQREAVAFLVALSSVVLFGVALIQNLRPAARVIVVERRTIAYMISVWGLCLALLFVLVSAGPMWTLVTLAATGALFARVWRRLPAAFAETAAESGGGGSPAASLRYGTIPVTAATADGRLSSAGQVTPSRRRWLMAKTVLLSLYRPVPVAATVALVLVFLGYYISGFYPEPLSGPVYVFWVIGLTPAFVVWPARNVFRLEHFPVSRRYIFPYLSLPAIGLICLGVVGGTIGGHLFSPRPPLREFIPTRECPFYTRVPDRFLEVAWNGAPASVVAPWGEAREPWTCRPVRGWGAVMYSPYSIPAGSSQRFVAWQVSREMEAIYGVEAPPGDLTARFDRYFEQRDDGAWVLRSWGDPLREDFPELRLQDWGRPLAIIVLVLGVVWFLSTAWMILAFYRGVSPTFFSLVGRVLPPAIPIFFVAVLIWLGDYGYTSSWKLTAMANILVRRGAGLLPSHPVALWTVVAAVLAAFYLLAESAFRRAQTLATKKLD